MSCLIVNLILQSHSRVGGYDDHSDESETSSVCSERSIDSVNRRSDVIFKLRI